MAMNEQTAMEDLAFIRKVMSDSKIIITGNGIDFIIWGIIVVVGLVYTYLDVVFDFSFGNAYTWFILVGAGWIFSLVKNMKYFKRTKVSSLSGKILGATWFSLGISATIFGFVGTLSGAYSGVYISPMIATVLAMAYLISGVVLNRFWFSMLSVCWWLGAIYMFIFPYLHSLIVMASMMLTFQVVPGIVLYMESKKSGEMI